MHSKLYFLSLSLSLSLIPLFKFFFGSFLGNGLADVRRPAASTSRVRVTEPCIRERQPAPILMPRFPGAAAPHCPLAFSTHVANGVASRTGRPGATRACVNEATNRPANQVSRFGPDMTQAGTT